METAQRPRGTPADASVADELASPEEPAGGSAAALSLALLGTRAVDAPRPPADAARGRVWGEAFGLLIVVGGLGVAEVELLSVPSWLGLVFVALGCAMAVDRLRLGRRPDPADHRRSRESVVSIAAAAPAALHPEREPEPAELDEDAAEPASALPALGYTCVPSAHDGDALTGDTDEITAWCAEAGMTLAKVVHDVDGQTGERSGGPALQWALGQLAKGEAGTLVVARLRNLSPTVADLPPLLRWFNAPERRLVAIDLGLDTANEAGRLAASALAGVGSWENERLSARTRRGLEAARSRGAGRAGAAVADVPELRERIVRMRNDGMTLQAIADALNDEGVPTLRGGAKWRPSSVHGATGYRRPSSARGIRVPGDPGSSTDR